MLVTLSSLSFSLHMCLNGEVITNKPQGGTGSFISSEKEHNTLNLNIFVVNFPFCFIFCIRHQLEEVSAL